MLVPRALNWTKQIRKAAADMLANCGLDKPRQKQNTLTSFSLNPQISHKKCIWVAAGTRGWRTPLAHSHGHLCASPMRQTTFRSISLVRAPYAPGHVSYLLPSLLPSSLPSHPSDRPPFNFRYAPDMRQSTVGTTSARRRRGHKIDSQVDQNIVTKRTRYL